MSGRDYIWHAASLLIEQRGMDAAFAAGQRISELSRKGDEAGAAVWGGILAAIAVMSEEPVTFTPTLH